MPLIDDPGLDLGQREPALEELRAQAAIPSGVAALLLDRQPAGIQQVRRDEERPRQRVDAADVGMEQVRSIQALTPELGVEVESARREAACAQDLVHGDRELVDRVRELVGVPAVLRVAAVHVDAAEDAAADRDRDLVLEAVAGQRGVVRLDVDPVLVREVVAHEEGIHRRGVVVVLMLRRLLRLRLEQQRPGEPDSMLVLRDEAQESRELRFLSGEIGVEERLVALAPTPQDVIRPPQPMRRLEHVLDLGGRIREHLGVGIGGRPRGVSRVAEEVGGAPEQPDAGALHVGFDLVHHGLEPVACLRERAALGRDVAVMEREERHAELRHELERGVDLRTCRLHRVRAGLQPRSIEGSDAEDIRPGPVERVPQADGDAEVILHPLAEDRRGRARRP